MRKDADCPASGGPRPHRRHVLKTAAGVTALGATGLAACGPQEDTSGNRAGGQGAPAAPAVARQKRELRMVTTWPKNFPGLGDAAEDLARFVAEATGGELTIKLFAAGELVPAFEAFDAVSSGAADLYHGADYYWQGKDKAFNFFCSVPLGLTANEMSAWIHHGGGQALWDRLSARFNIKPFGCGNTGAQMGGWFLKDINSLEDLRGLTIRIPGLGGEVMRKLGASATALAGGEIFQSLQTGVIDGTEWVGPWNDLAFGFHRIAKNYYWPGLHEPGTLLSTGMNLDVWNSLSKPHQAIFAQACMAVTDYNLAAFNARNAAALRTLIDEHDVNLRRFPEEVIGAFAQASAEVLDAVAAGDAFAQEVYDSFRAARQVGSAWGRYSDEAFTAARRQILGDG